MTILPGRGIAADAMDEPARIVEAILFAAETPLTLAAIAAHAGRKASTSAPP